MRHAWEATDSEFKGEKLEININNLQLTFLIKEVIPEKWNGNRFQM